jgi:RNA-directed DNA polymerase
MKKSYVEGLAGHNGPESCVGAREGVGEALTGVRAGRVFNRVTTNPPGCRRHRERRKATSGVPPVPGTPGPRAVKDPVHVRKHLAREPGGPMFTRSGGGTGRIGKSKDERRW